jgi:molybdate transport repressor ModE-like protein
VRIDLDSEGRIGPGKIQLLENIQKFGSISAAGRDMDLSYKRAWDVVEEMNSICRQAAVERQTRRQKWRRRGAHAVRPLAGRTLPQIERAPPARCAGIYRRCG